MTRDPAPRHDESHGQSASDCTVCEAEAIRAAQQRGPFRKWPPRERTGIPEPSEDLKLADGLRSWTGPK